MQLLTRVEVPQGIFVVSTVDLAGDFESAPRIFSQLGGRYETIVLRVGANNEVEVRDLDRARTDDLASVEKQHEEMVKKWKLGGSDVYPLRALPLQ